MFKFTEKVPVKCLIVSKSSIKTEIRWVEYKKVEIKTEKNGSWQRDIKDKKRVRIEGNKPK